MTLSELWENLASLLALARQHEQGQGNREISQLPENFCNYADSWQSLPLFGTAQAQTPQNHALKQSAQYARDDLVAIVGRMRVQR